MSATSEGLLHPIAQRPGLTLNLSLWALLVAIAALFASSLAALARVWSENASYQHGFLVAVICLGMLLQRRERISSAPVRSQFIALPLLALVLFAWMVALRANSELLQQLAFPVVVVVAVYAAFGAAIARIVAIPAAYFYFAVPIWDHTIPVLQWMSTQVNERLLGLLGVPTQVEGFTVTIPAGTFAIVEGCSGVRYVVISLALATLMGIVQKVRGRRFVALLGLTLLAALVTNWLRIAIVIYAGHLTNMTHYLVAVEHHTLGYALYLPLILFIALLGRRLAGPAESKLESPSHSVSSAAILRGIGAPCMLLLIAQTVLSLGPTATDVSVRLGSPPLLTGEWQGPLPPEPEWVPGYRGAQGEWRASYSNGIARVDAYANVYGLQSADRELIHFDNSAWPKDRWRVVRTIDVDPSLSAVIATEHDQRWVIALWSPAPAGAIALAAACEPDCSSAATAIRSFWSAHGAELRAMVPVRF
jgi:exosortase